MCPFVPSVIQCHLGGRYGFISLLAAKVSPSAEYNSPRNWAVFAEPYQFRAKRHLAVPKQVLAAPQNNGDDLLHGRPPTLAPMRPWPGGVNEAILETKLLHLRILSRGFGATGDGSPGVPEPPLAPQDGPVRGTAMVRLLVIAHSPEWILLLAGIRVFFFLFF